MPRRIEEEIQENRRSARRLNSYFREPATDQETILSFAPIELVASIEATVYTRPLNDTLIAGAPGPNQAAGTGRAGDHRGSWTQVATVSGGDLLDAGETAIADALAGERVGFEHVGAGTGLVDGWFEKTDADTTTAIGVIPATKLPGSVATVDVADQDDSVLLEASSIGVDPAIDEEIKVEVAVTLSPSATSSVAVTGLDTITDLLASEADVGGIKWLALGTDGSSPSQSDTGLGTEEIRKEVSHDTGGGLLAVATEVFRSEPADQPHDFAELGAIAADGTLVWRRTFGTERKDDRIRLAVRDGFDPR